MRIALAQINPTVGDVAGNAQLIREDIRRAWDAGAEMVVFPELAIIGYPPKDLLLKPAVVDDCVAAVEELAEACRGITAIIGYPAPSDSPRGRSLHNAAAVCYDGAIQKRHLKSLLPTYDVFDEMRYFEPGPSVDLTTVGQRKLGISICEDLWNDEGVFSRQLYHDNPIGTLSAMGAELFVNCAASPYVLRKHKFRTRLMSHVANRYNLPLVYCNQVGGNDELIFDGNSCAFDANGKVVAHAKDFEPDLLIVDLPGLASNGVEAAATSGSAAGVAINRMETPESGVASAYHALVLGIQDYCGKCGFESVVLGLSGGIDSAVTAALAVAALGRQNVRGIAMPSRFSSEGSVTDARLLAEALDIRFDVLPIAEPHAAFETLVEPCFEGHPVDATEENIQARIRGIILMAFSNKFGSLLVTTGNKSELAVGYCTLYGDMAGGLAALSDVPKTMVYELARWINDDPASPLRVAYGKAVIPEDTITKPPSAELRPDQVDQDSLPPYDVLDQIIERYVERDQPAAQIIEEMQADAEVVYRIVRLIDINEYKRKQAAPGLKITGRAFGFGRRMPIAQRYDNRAGMTAKSGVVERVMAEK